MGPEGEAPEDAIREAEPPESWEEWHTEAPDAGQEGVTALNANSRMAEAGAERSGQATWPARRPHRTVPPAGRLADPGRRPR